MKVTIKNRLAVLIRMRGLRSASEFGRRMTEAGFPMSSSHASRFEKDDMPATDLRFVNAACNVLQCLPDDLYEITVELAEGEEVDPSLTFPRHAIVRSNQAKTQIQVHYGVEPELPVRPDTWVPVGPAALKPLKAKAVESPIKGGDPDTGPKITLFPYGKN